MNISHVRAFLRAAGLGGAYVPLVALDMLSQRDAEQDIAAEEINGVLRAASNSYNPEEPDKYADSGPQYVPELVVFPWLQLRYESAAGMRISIQDGQDYVVVDAGRSTATRAHLRYLASEADQVVTAAQFADWIDEHCAEEYQGRCIREMLAAEVERKSTVA